MSVYFAQRDSDGLVKIGTSSKVQDRMKHLEFLHKSKFTLLREVEGRHAEEVQAHKHFGPPAEGREFFTWSPEMVTWHPEKVYLSTASLLLRNWLDEQAIFITWLASQVPADRATVSQWLTGRRKPLPPARRRLAEITGLPVDAKEAWE
jgi:hypothetical protein